MKGANEIRKRTVNSKKGILPDLERLQQSGVEFFIDGEVVHAGEVVKRAVQEPCTYMADYVLGENGTVKQVRLDRVDL